MNAEFADQEIAGDTPRSDVAARGVERDLLIGEHGGASLDGREFVMESSTASRVDPDAPTRFRYHEADGVLWGDYTGDTVTEGRFVGTREGARIEVSFVHALVAGGAVVRGAAVSRVEPGAAGLRLVEDFEVEGRPQISVCVEVPPA